MAFCSIEDVAKILGFESFTDNTTPTKDTIEGFIDIIYNRMVWNFEKYNVQVDTTKWADFLKYLNSVGAGALVLKSYVQNPSGDLKFAIALDELFAKELIDFCFFLKTKKMQPDYYF